MNLRAFFSAGILVCLSGAAAGGVLEEALASALQAKALRGAQVGALVVDARDGTVLFEQASDRRLVPASNLKILTALAALERFGPTHRFETRVLADAPPNAQGSIETLYLQGVGDPTLTSESWWRLAADLRLAGLRCVRGGIVVDDSAFDTERWHPSWGPVTSRAYYAPIGALTANYGSFLVVVTAGASAGDPVAVALDPPVDFLRVVNQARTGKGGSGDRLRVQRVSADAADEVRVSGSLPAASGSRRFYRSVGDPGRYAAHVARLQLEANGIDVAGPVRRGPVPAGAHEMLAFEGRPLAEVVRLLVKYSNNPIAETLVKAMAVAGGAEPGSWPAGTAALLDQLGALGMPLSGLTVVDGSGLSRDNRVTAHALVQALRVAQRSFALGPELLAALPIAARDGTLEKRAAAAAGRVRAKTGLLDGVTGLSGYAELADGRPVVFSVLVNGYRSSDEAAMDAVDAFAAALVGTEVESDSAAGGVSSRAAWLP
jgi:D-alanyl-D-alanine carboxypeptidase/D-alanyl-D-alanine-endopeptidase (penicillin-binding protein 4)